MSSTSPFDSGYVNSNLATDIPKKKSDTKKFLKQPISQDDLLRYGDSKPIRIRLRAKLIHG
jgi:hypothetical protein